MISKAFCPGHVTGFFEVHMKDELTSSGSRGAGMCLSLGATTEIELADSAQTKIEVRINGEVRKAETTTRALERLMGERTASVIANTTLDLPERQGFGMSAAGAFSACFALCDALDLDCGLAYQAAHAAEIECATGMGDVSAIRCGGIEIREVAGLPPVGRVRRIDGRPNVVLAVIGKPFSTAEALADSDLMTRVNREGARRVDELLAEPNIHNLMRLSSSFARDTGLASQTILDAIESAASVGTASMSMLGNSVFSIGETEALATALSAHGSIYRCSVDVVGARVVED